MSEVRELEKILNKLESERNKMKQVAKGGFFGLKKKQGGNINFENDEVGDTSLSSKKIVARGAGFMGSRADKMGENYQNQGYWPVTEKMGGALSGGKKMKQMERVCQCGGVVAGSLGGMEAGSMGGRMKKSTMNAGDWGGGSVGGVYAGSMKKMKKEEIEDSMSDEDGGDWAGGRKRGRPKKKVSYGGDWDTVDHDTGVGAGHSKTSPWIKYVKAYAKKHKISYREALSQAGPSYHH